MQVPVLLLLRPLWEACANHAFLFFFSHLKEGYYKNRQSRGLSQTDRWRWHLWGSAVRVYSSSFLTQKRLAPEWKFKCAMKVSDSLEAQRGVIWSRRRFRICSRTMPNFTCLLFQFVQLCIKSSLKLGCVASKGARSLLLTFNVKRRADIHWTQRSFSELH